MVLNHYALKMVILFQLDLNEVEYLKIINMKAAKAAIEMTKNK